MSYFLSDVEIPESIFILLINASRPLRFIYAISLFITSVTIVLPVYFILKSEKVLRASLNIIERLSLLMTLYLVLDLGALVVVLIRNL